MDSDSFEQQFFPVLGTDLKGTAGGKVAASNSLLRWAAGAVQAGNRLVKRVFATGDGSPPVTTMIQPDHVFQHVTAGMESRDIDAPKGGLNGRFPKSAVWMQCRDS